MNREQRTIHKDYRPQPVGSSATAPHRLPWFGVGLAIAILSVTLFKQFSATDEPAAKNATTAATLMPAIAAPATTTATAAANETELTPLAPEFLNIGTSDSLAPRYPELALEIDRGDTLDGLFRKNELDLGDLVVIARLPAAKSQLRVLKPGDVIYVAHDEGRVQSLRKELGHSEELQVSRDDDGQFVAELIEKPAQVREVMRHGVIETSLFESAVTAGLSDNVIMNVAGIFAWDIDFVLDIRVGDEYFVLYEEIWRDGKRVADGEIIAAEFHANRSVYHAIRHIDESGQSEYFAADGRSVRKSFLRAPVDFTRISSNFNPNRRHPILNTIRAHRGVDYAAPRGTAVQAAGSGKIIFRGRKTGYGNVVIVQHPKNITTLYAHLSNFDRNAGNGSRVKQGQTIGYVGATGLATAPHLHYEYRVNGVHRNPRTVKLPAAEPIDARYRDAFEVTASEVMKRLDSYKQTKLARLD